MIHLTIEKQKTIRTTAQVHIFIIAAIKISLCSDIPANSYNVLFLNWYILRDWEIVHTLFQFKVHFFGKSLLNKDSHFFAKIAVNLDVIGCQRNKPIDVGRVWELGECCGNKQDKKRSEEGKEKARFSANYCFGPFLSVQTESENIQILGQSVIAAEVLSSGKHKHTFKVFR